MLPSPISASSAVSSSTTITRGALVKAIALLLGLWLIAAFWRFPDAEELALQTVLQDANGAPKIPGPSNDDGIPRGSPYGFESPTAQDPDTKQPPPPPPPPRSPPPPPPKADEKLEPKPADKHPAAAVDRKPTPPADGVASGVRAPGHTGAVHRGRAHARAHRGYHRASPLRASR
ncbi:hypothetical protein F4779DRAFT_157166 [Xylariaceae sp. FL0662B]|nr:hypothetical protein F4779DRAFT_157166 [Xylariaceae sp. FL0662B]